MHNKDNNTTIIVKDSVNSTCKLIDMTIPSDGNIALKEIEKESKYKDLELEIQRMWKMKNRGDPVVVGVLGTVKKGMVENIKKVSERATVTETQKICMLGSAQSSRRCLLYEQNDWLQWLTLQVHGLRPSDPQKVNQQRLWQKRQ